MKINSIVLWAIQWKLPKLKRIKANKIYPWDKKILSLLSYLSDFNTTYS